MKKQQRLLQLFYEVEIDEEKLPVNDEDKDVVDNVEVREEDSESHQEGKSDSETETSVGPQFLDKIGVTNWNKYPFSQRVRTRKSNLLVQSPGVKRVATSAKPPLQCWQLFFFTDEMLTSIIEDTNKYIDKMSENFSRPRDAKYTNLAEIKALIGLLHLAGCLKKSRLSTEKLWNRQRRCRVILAYNVFATVQISSTCNLHIR